MLKEGNENNDLNTFISLQKTKEITEFSPLDTDYNQFITTLREWSGKKIETIIFDSDIDDWKNDTLQLILLNKSNLYFISFDDNNNIVGGYFSDTITRINTFLTDDQSFVFSIRKNGIITLQKFHVKPVYKGICLNIVTNSSALYMFGSDLVVGLVNSPYSCSILNCFDYKDVAQPFGYTTNEFYVTNRILIIQMN
ncbi:TLDc domain-containing protein [Entamoeba marina]